MQPNSETAERGIPVVWMCDTISSNRKFTEYIFIPILGALSMVHQISSIDLASQFKLFTTR